MTRFSRCWIFALFPLTPVACATQTQNGPDGANPGGGSNSAGDANASGGGAGGTAGTSSIGGKAGGGASSTAGGGAGGAPTAGSPGAGMGGSTGGMGGVASGGGGAGGVTGGGGNGGNAGSGGTGGNGGGAGGTTGGGGSQSGGAGSGGNGGSGGSSQTPYCDSHTKSALPYTVNEGFQPSFWQGDTLAITTPTAMPDACAARPAGAVGICTTWRFTPNAVTPAWAGVAWSTKWDAGYTHPPVCIADGATKVTFQARGAVGGEQVTFSGAGSAEVPVTLTNAWKAYSLSLNGVMYNTTVDGVEAGFFWKAEPNAGTITFFIDDIQIEK